VWIRPPGIDNLVQRVWSNRAAAASHDPCQPSGLSPYFNSAPVVTDTVSVTDPSGATFQTKGVTIPVGQTKTIELDLYSDAPTAGPWTLIALDVTSALFGGSPVLALSLDKNQGRNGDKRELTIRALRKAPRGAAAFWIQNDLAAAGTVWIGVVGN
jgi:hypothetical protein